MKYWAAHLLQVDELVFATTDPARPKTFCGRVAGAVNRLHDVRHTAATVMLTMGVPPRVAMQVLGRSQISLTLGAYSHVMPELATEAADRIGEALWGTGTRATDAGPPPRPSRTSGRGR